MQFNPNLHSVIFALNLDTPEEERAIIREFYDGPIVELIGVWEGEEERSYQLDLNSKLNVWALDNALYACDQDAYIILKPSGYTLLAKPHSRIHQGIGYMDQIEAKQDACTYCPSTHTYWKALKWA